MIDSAPAPARVSVASGPAPQPPPAARSGSRRRYLDRWSRRAGRWAIDHRVWVLDFDEQDRPVTARPPGGGSRDRSDPSYALFDGPHS